MKSGRGKRIADDIRREVARLYLDNGLHSPDKILDVMSSNSNYLNRLPSSRWVSNVIKEIKARYDGEQQRLDQLWQLRPVASDGRLPDGISLEAVSGLLEARRELITLADSFPITIRAAKWYSALVTSLNKLKPADVLINASMYAQRERWAILEERELDTTDLDLWVAFHMLGTEQAHNAYIAGVELELIPVQSLIEFATELHPGHPESAERTLASFDSYRNHIDTGPAHDARPGFLQVLTAIPEDRQLEFQIRMRAFADQGPWTPEAYVEGARAMAERMLENDDRNSSAVSSPIAFNDSEQLLED